MKIQTLAVSLTVLFAAGVMSAQTPMATKPGTPAVAPDKKKEPEYKIPGITIPRTNGTFLGLEVVNGNFKLSFYDKKKKPMAVDVTRATARWPNKKSATTGDNRTVLNGSGTYLLGARPVVPPFAFNVFLTLLQGEGDDAKAVETYVVPFNG